MAGCLDPESPDATKLRSIPQVNVFGLDVTKQESLDHALEQVESILQESQNGWSNDSSRESSCKFYMQVLGMPSCKRIPVPILTCRFAPDLWAVVCNAGLCEIGEVEWMGLDKMQQMLDVNVMGSVRTVKTFAPLLRRSKGRVVLCSSVFGEFDIGFRIRAGICREAANF